MITTDPQTCDHGVSFDYDVASKQNLGAEEVRKRWPRGFFTAEKPCPHCGYVGIHYASKAHYVYGDW